MQFDSDGNLFVYEPGAGCLGTPRKIPQGFTQEDLDFNASKQYTNGWNKFASIPKVHVHRIVGQNAVKTFSMRTEKRYNSISVFCLGSSCFHLRFNRTVLNDSLHI